MVGLYYRDIYIFYYYFNYYCNNFFFFYRDIYATERPAAFFVWFVPGTRIFLARVVYMVLQGSSYLSATKILVLGTYTMNPLHVDRMQKPYGARMIRLLGSSSLRTNSPLN